MVHPGTLKSLFFLDPCWYFGLLLQPAKLRRKQTPPQRSRLLRIHTFTTAGQTFSAVQTVWRSAQSGANLSPPEFPRNREKYREFARFCAGESRSHFSKLLIPMGRGPYLV